VTSSLSFILQLCSVCWTTRQPRFCLLRLQRTGWKRLWPIFFSHRPYFTGVRAMGWLKRKFSVNVRKLLLQFTLASSPKVSQSSWRGADLPSEVKLLSHFHHLWQWKFFVKQSHCDSAVERGSFPFTGIMYIIYPCGYFSHLFV